ncbi:MAG: R3H domain-containing nucleic acid-binding protein [Cyanobacteria bacterium P01_H01_bin.119]
MVSLNDDKVPNSSSMSPETASNTNHFPAPASAGHLIADDLEQLIAILPPDLRHRVDTHPQRQQLVEIVLDLGRRPEARFPSGAEYLSEMAVSEADLTHCIDRVGSFSSDNRAGIEQTLHRISAIRNRAGAVVGLTCRVGRAVFGPIGLIRDLIETGQSILLLGRPGVGKTTALREIARVLADDLQKRVVIIDTSNEIAGDGDIPHPAIGRARRMQVAQPELQHKIMIEAVENHMPEVIVIDEIGTELEALAARTIAERGVQLVGTAHGNQIENLIKNPTLSDLIGGIQSVTLGDDEARRRGSQKSVLERKAPPTFEIAVEMTERERWVVHESVTATIDSLLRGRQPTPQVRTMGDNGKVKVTHELSSQDANLSSSGQRLASAAHWRASGRMVPLRDRPNSQMSYIRRLEESRAEGKGITNDQGSFQSLLDQSLSSKSFRSAKQPSGDLTASEADDIQPSWLGPNGEDIVHVYPYGISRHHLEQAIHALGLPVILTKDLDSADVVLALRSQVKTHSKLRHIAKARQIPIQVVKSNSMPQIVRGLQRFLDLDDDSSGLGPVSLDIFSRSGSDDELEALEEARLAVEQIVIPKGQPVELLPRSAKVRKMQHELAEHYRLKSTSFGDEPNRRLRIYPA